METLGEGSSTGQEANSTSVEADGYNTLNGLKTLETELSAEQASGQNGPARQEAATATAACRS